VFGYPLPSSAINDNVNIDSHFLGKYVVLIICVLLNYKVPIIIAVKQKLIE